MMGDAPSKLLVFQDSLQILVKSGFSYALNQWGRVLHDPDLATAILDRVLERGRLIKTDGPSGRTRHLKLDQDFPQDPDRARIPGTSVPEFPEPTAPVGAGSDQISL